MGRRIAERDGGRPRRRAGRAALGAALLLPGLVLACLGGREPVPRELDAWVHVLPGRQCELTPAVHRDLLDAERRQLEAVAVRPRELHAAASLDALPADCRPEGGTEALLAKAADARAEEVTDLLSLMACAACGCPEPWFVCLRAEVPDRQDLEPLGYLRVR